MKYSFFFALGFFFISGFLYWLHDTLLEQKKDKKQPSMLWHLFKTDDHIVLFKIDSFNVCAKFGKFYTAKMDYVWNIPRFNISNKFPYSTELKWDFE